MGVTKVSSRVTRTLPFLSAVLAFIVRIYPYAFIAAGWVVEDGTVAYWFRMFTEGHYIYLSLYPHTAIFGMSALVRLGIPVDWAAKVWSPLMGAVSTVLIYKLLTELGHKENAVYGAILYACLDSSVYRQSTLATSLEATAVMFALLFIWLWHRGVKASYLLLPVVAYSHYIVFFVTFIYLFLWWWTHTSVSLVKRVIAASLLGGGLIVLLAFLPVGYALPQLLDSITHFSLNKFVYVYGSEEVFLLMKTLLVTSILFSVNLITTKSPHLRLVSAFYVAAVVFSMMFYSPIISPYRLIVHMGVIGILGSIPLLSRLTTFKRILLVGVLCLISLGQIYSYGLDRHIHVNDTLTREELGMLKWLHQHDGSVGYSRLLWDDVGIENSLNQLFIMVEVDPYTTREKDYKTWYAAAEVKKILVEQQNNGNSTVEGQPMNITDPTPPHIKYIMYSTRFAERALYRLPEGEYNKLIYRNYVIDDLWSNSPYWVLIYDNLGGKIYERKAS